MKKLNKALLLVAGVLGFNAAFAATDTDTIQLDAIVPTNLEIAELEDIDFGNFALGDGNDGSSDSNFCIGTNLASNLYDIEFQAFKDDGTTALNDFEMHSGSNTLPYSVEFSEDGSVGNLSSVAEDALNEDNTGQTHACTAGTDNSKVRVTVSAANMDTAEPGTYVGKLKVIVTDPA